MCNQSGAIKQKKQIAFGGFSAAVGFSLEFSYISHSNKNIYRIGKSDHSSGWSGLS